MNRSLKFIYSNKIFAFVMLIIQILIIVFGYKWLNEYSKYLFSLTSVLGAVLIIIEINRDEDPMFKLTWCILIATFPVFGGLMYVYLHTDFMRRDIAKAQERSHKEIIGYMNSGGYGIKETGEFDGGERGFIKYLTENGGSPAYKNTSVKYYPLGDEMFKEILEELETAEKFIFLEFFIINQSGRFWPEILSVLKRKVKDGVDVRMMFDGMGCLSTLPKKYTETMEKFGIKCKIFSPVQPLISTYQNNRDHRKILVIDGKTAFTGGINLADEYANFISRFGHWKDTGIKLKGEAVSGFTALFFEMWNMSELCENTAEFIAESREYPQQSDGIVIPYGDSPNDREYVGKRVYIYLMNRAERYCHIMTPYLVIDNETFEALKFAAQRGVDVKIMMPHIPDKKMAFRLARTYYPELIRAGIKIYEYTPGFVHAKTIVSDDVRAVVGTINFDFRSLYLHYECAAYMYNAPAVLDIEDDYKKTLEKCELITLDTYKKLPFFQKLIGRVLKLIAPLI